MSAATFTFRVDEALKNEFATAAKARDCTGAQLLRDFMCDFVRRKSKPSSRRVEPPLAATLKRPNEATALGLVVSPTLASW